jgi:nitrous oxidase accessory protein
MGNSGKSFASLLALIFIASIVILQPVTVNADSKTITVPDDYPTIQQAVNLAQSGDAVYVKQGIYYETVVIDKPLTLKGIGYPIIDANHKGNAIIVNASNCIVDGFKVTNSLQSYSEGGISVQRFSGGNNIIKNNIIYNNRVYGIYAVHTAHNSIINNTVFENYLFGIECMMEK